MTHIGTAEVNMLTKRVAELKKELDDARQCQDTMQADAGKLEQELSSI